MTTTFKRSGVLADAYKGAALQGRSFLWHWRRDGEWVSLCGRENLSDDDGIESSNCKECQRCARKKARLAELERGREGGG